STLEPAVPRPAAVTPSGEAVAVGSALETAVRSENAGDWPAALTQYENARGIEPSMTTFIDAAVARVKTQMASDGLNAFRRAREYDALGRPSDAALWYERAARFLPDSDPNKA